MALFKNLKRFLGGNPDQAETESPSRAPAGEPTPPVAAADPAVLAGIRANAKLVIETCGPLTDFEFGYSAESVEWLAGYIERLRAQGASEADLGQYTSVFGSFLGEAILASFGGQWALDEHGWHIAFDARNKAYPFAKVEKQIHNGLEDSIAGFYSVIPTVFARRS